MDKQSSPTKPTSRLRPTTSVSSGSTTARVSRRTAQLTGSAGRTRRPSRNTQMSSPLLPAIAVLAVLAVLALLILLFIIPACSPKPSPYNPPAEIVAGQEVIVTIPEGSSGESIALELVNAGVIEKPEDFFNEIKRQEADQKLKSGTYSFVTLATPSEVVKQLVMGPNTAEGRLVVQEGLTVDKTAAVVEASLGIAADDFIEQAKASNYASEFPFLAAAKDDSLEGFLYPKTYDFTGKDLSADTVIRAMLTQYQSEVTELDFAAAAQRIQTDYGITMSDYDLLTMASIIEREAVTDEDRPLISSVFYNRLKQDMALQSDATIGYVTGGEVSAADLEIDSPYNTYLYRGLTPTPVCSPSYESLQAALNPANTNYLYFVNIGTESGSSHTFSETYEEHQAVIDQALNEQQG